MLIEERFGPRFGKQAAQGTFLVVWFAVVVLCLSLLGGFLVAPAVNFLTDRDVLPNAFDLIRRLTGQWPYLVKLALGLGISGVAGWFGTQTLLNWRFPEFKRIELDAKLSDSELALRTSIAQLDETRLEFLFRVGGR